MKKWLQWLGRFVGILLVLLASYFLMVLIGGLIRVQSPVSEGASKERISIWVRSNGVHTDIVMPADKSWRLFLGKEVRAAFLAFGQGDKAFYLNTPTWDDLTAGTALNALFLPTETVMHVTPFRSKPRTDKHCIQLELTKPEYRALTDYIRAGFKLNPDDRPQYIPESYGYGDRFYEGTGYYHLFRTCNEWTNQGLKAAGQPACWFSPLDWGILYQLRQ